MYTPLPPISGGCGTGELTRQVNNVGFKTRRGLTGIIGESDMCFRDAVLCSLFSRDLYLIHVAEEEAKCKDHRRFCRCRKKAEKLFQASRKKGRFVYLHYNIMTILYYQGVHMTNLRIELTFLEFNSLPGCQTSTDLKRIINTYQLIYLFIVKASSIRFTLQTWMGGNLASVSV